MRRIYKIFNPEVFQGSLDSTNYFEGWYFKHVSHDRARAFAIIPGISLSEDPHAFIQFIDGMNRQTAYFRFDTDQFESDRKRFTVKIGDSYFSEEQIRLSLQNERFNISGTLEYTGNIRLPKTILRPGIMGWYSYVPAMECNHGVVSIDHRISGSLNINGVVNDFTNGRGYIEKDWGTSFPESWLWLQCNNFSSDGTSLMVSVAKIPWKGHYFIGLISFLTTGGNTEIFATYNNASVRSLRQLNKNVTGIVIQKGKKVLTINVTKSGSGTIVAPSQGKMTNMIKESINSDVSFTYDNGAGKTINDAGHRAGYEEMEKIFTYFW